MDYAAEGQVVLRTKFHPPFQAAAVGVQVDEIREMQIAGSDVNLTCLGERYKLVCSFWPLCEVVAYLPGRFAGPLEALLWRCGACLSAKGKYLIIVVEIHPQDLILGMSKTDVGMCRVSYKDGERF
jgi:hypothetical protein